MLYEMMGRPPVPEGALGGPAYTLSVSGTALMLEFGARVRDENGQRLAPVDVVLETDSRKPSAKHEILEMYVQHGLELPDTPTMALHDNTELVVAHTSSGAEELARRLPNALVVSAFNTVPSEVLFGVYETRSKGRRPSLVYCGDDEGSKAVAAELIRDVGFDPLDVGPLRIARYTEPFALLVAELAYEGEGGPELAYRFEWFRK
jgi:hypothetical protein